MTCGWEEMFDDGTGICTFCAERLAASAVSELDQTPNEIILPGDPDFHL